MEFVKTNSSICRHGAGELWDFCKALQTMFDVLSPTDECGIVAQISEPLAAADIPAYYISTFKFDHALVSMNPASLE